VRADERAGGNPSLIPSSLQNTPDVNLSSLQQYMAMKHSEMAFTFKLRSATKSLIIELNRRYNNKVDRVWCYAKKVHVRVLDDIKVEVDTYHLVVGVLRSRGVVCIPRKDTVLYIDLGIPMCSPDKAVVHDREEDVIRHLVKNVNV